MMIIVNSRRKTINLFSVNTAAKPAATSSESRPQNIKQRLLIVVLYLPHLMSARHSARGYRKDKEMPMQHIRFHLKGLLWTYYSLEPESSQNQPRMKFQNKIRIAAFDFK